MSDLNHKSKFNIKHIIFFVILLVFIAVFIEIGITQILIDKSAEKSTTLLLNQVEKVLVDNKAREEEHTEELKETYLSYAKTIAYILDKDPVLINDVDELRKIAKLQNVDEIHIFDTTGKIVAGTEPKYYGYSFESGEQMAFFKPMLSDFSLSLCQDITPNTAEGKSMMYGMVWDPNCTFMVEVGVEPIRFLSELKDNDIVNVLNHIPLTEGFEIYAVDINSGEMVASTSEKLLSLDFLSEYSISAAKGTIPYEGEKYYYNYELMEDYAIAVVYAMSYSASSRYVPVIVIATFMSLAGLLIVLLFSRLYRANKAAEAADKAKSMFLFNMSHDIRTPMNAIMGFTRLLKEHRDDNKLFDEYIGKIESSNELLLSIINNVLDMARIESGKETVVEEAFDMMEIKREIIPLFTEQMEEKGITFITKSDFKHRYIYVDGTKLKNIYLNLLSNACKYTPSGGTVTMSSKEYPTDKPDYIMIETIIEDTGIGMSKEFLDTLFEPFARERTSTQSKTTGTGLGMAIVKNLVDMMGGTIEVESELGKGTKFTVRSVRRLVEDQSKIPQAESENVIDPKAFAGKKILLAEDNDLNAEIAISILEESGFKVERAEDGAKCIEMLYKAENTNYDLILMDIQMPNMDGYTAARLIREMPDMAKATIPIIAMTANAFDKDKKNAISAGMNGHIAKPIDIDELFKQLASVLNK
ncbi:MAG: response regulator [Erysipelotrichaceae bacterium]|nr:response regulator [Erysipelotrichaceae bacterium]